MARSPKAPPTEQEVWINGKRWIAAEPLRYALQATAPAALMVGQNTHADTQGLLEHPVDLRGHLGSWEQKLGEEDRGNYIMAPLLIANGEVSLPPKQATTTPANMSTALDAGCSYCVSDIDGTQKVYVVYGDRMWKASATTFTLVGQVANARGMALIETHVGRYRRALMWGCGAGADLQISYDGINLTAPWSGERADLVWNQSFVAAQSGPLGVAIVPMLIRDGKVKGLRVYSSADEPSADWRLHPALLLGALTGWSGFRYLGELSTSDPSVAPGHLAALGFAGCSLIAGRGVIGIALCSYASMAPGASYYVSSIPFPETEMIGDIIAGCRFLDCFALSNGKPPVYLWSPNETLKAIGPFGTDGIPSVWAGMVIRHLFADGPYLLALVSIGSSIYLFRYDSQTDTWDIPATQAGSYVGGSTPALVVRGALAGGTAPGGEIEMVPDGAGNYDTWILKMGMSGEKYATLVEDEPDNDETYLSAPTGVGDHRQTFTMSNVAVPTGYSIIGVRIEACVRRAGTYGQQAAKLTIRSAATDADSPTFAQLGQMERVPGGIYDGTAGVLSSGLFGYGHVNYTWYTDPATGVAWTQAGVNALEGGILVSGIAPTRITWLRAFCVYAGTASAATMVNRLWYHAGGASPALPYLTLPEDGSWNLRGSGIDYAAGGLGSVLYSRTLTFNRPERQKIVYGVRFHGHFNATHYLRFSYMADGASPSALQDVKADGTLIRFGSGKGVVCYTFEPIFVFYGGNTTDSPVLAHKGCVIEYDEVTDKRLLIGLKVDLKRTAQLRAPPVVIETIVEELEGLMTGGLLFTFKWVDRPERYVKVAPATYSDLMEELRRVGEGVVTLWLTEPIPSA